MDEHTTQSVRRDVMEAIHKGRVRMRPRWHFVLLSLLVALGSVIVVLALLYATSLSVFLMRESGMWFAPSFGVRGWHDLFRALPVALLILTALFVVLLEILVRRYAFVYRKSLLVSIAGILIMVFGGGYAIAQTSFHRNMAFFAHRHALPPPFDMLYSPHMRPARPPDAFRGTIVATSSNGFTIRDQDSDVSARVVVTPRTRLPYGEDFSVGASVLIMGDMVATDTIQAYGVLEIED